MKIIHLNFNFLLLVIIIGCGSGNSESHSGIQHISELKTKQYAIEGQQLYLKYCSNCHQEDGTGLQRLMPPLANSDYMLADVGNTIRVIKYGLKGSITVNGLEYNQPMPGNPSLTPLEIAQISTYIYNVWGNKKGMVTLPEVNQALALPSPSGGN